MILLLLALSAPPDLLAPTTRDLDQTLGRVEALVREAEAVDRAWGAGQRGWLEQSPSGWCRPVKRCANRVAEARARARGSRRLVQGARAEWARAIRMRAFRPLDTLVRGKRRARWHRLEAEVARAARRYLRRLDFHRRYVEPWARAHPGPVAEADCALARSRGGEDR